MSTIIQIKRSSGTSAPATLKLGELAYTYGTGTQGNLGDRLFVGEGGVDGNGDANNITVIGGQYFTDQLDHVQGTLTASSAILVDSNKAIDELFVGNSTSTGGTIKFNEGTDNGSNYVALKAANNIASSVTFTLPSSDGTNGQALLTDGSGTLSFGDVASSLTIADESSSTISIDLSTEDLTVTGGEGIDTSVAGNTITISGEDASDTNKGIASFDATDFSVSSGNVTLQSERIQDIAGAMFTGNTETLITATYQDADGTIDLVVDNDLSNYDNTTAGFITASSTDTLTNKTINASQLVDGSVTNAKLANSSISVTVDDSTVSTISLGETLKIAGGTGINSTISGDTITLAVDSTIVTESSTDTLTNKTIDSANNTLTIDLSEATVTGTTAEFNTALSDGSFATLAGTETLTNKTISGASNTLSNIGNSSLTNSTITVAGDSGSNAVDLGDTLTIQGTANEIETAVSGDTITIGLPNDVTIGQNLTVTGNLTVNGATTTISTTNTVASDTLFELGNGTTGSPANDSGIVIERGDSDNAFIGFDESADKFIVGTGTFTGASTGNLTITTGTLVANLEATTATLGGSDVLSTDNTKTVTNKTISGSSNTISDIGNSSLTNSSFSIFDETSTSSSIALGGSLQITGGEGIDTSIVGNVITIAGELATTSNKGVASFSSDNFTVTSGAVTVTAIDGGTF